MVGWVVGGGEGGNGLASEKRREPGLFVALLGGTLGCEFVDGGGDERNCRLRCAVGALRAGVGHGLPWGGARVCSRVCWELWKGGVLVGAVLLGLALVWLGLHR